MKNVSGQVVTGEDFWDREDDLRLFIDRIDEGLNLLLVAQRRMGKTSLMLEAKRRLEDRYICLYVDLEQAFTAPDVIARIGVATYPHKPLRHKAFALFSNAINGLRKAVDQISISEVGIHLRSGLDAGNWSQKGDDLLAILAASQKPVVLMLDEVPIAVNRMLKGADYVITPDRRRDGDEFMSWLRRNSIEHQGKLRIVLTGSIGFEPVLHQAGLSATLNTFKPFELRPWSQATAVECLNVLAAAYGITFVGAAADRMVDKLGCCIPNYVQAFFDHVRQRCVRRGVHEFHEEEVDEAYEEEMLGTRGHVELTHYEERLKMILGTELLPLALDMLSEAAVQGCLGRDALETLRQGYAFGGRTVAEVQMEILSVLEHDGYLQSSGEGYMFVSSLLRDWWKKRYEAFYTPVLKRKGSR